MKPYAIPVPEKPLSLVAGTLPVFAALAAIAICASLMPSFIWSVLSMVAFLAYVAIMAQRAPFSLVLMLDFIFFRFTTLMSGVGISMGSWMTEINLTGQPSAAFPLLAVVYVIFTLIAALIIEKPVRALAEKHLPNAPDFTKQWWLWPLFGVILLVCFYVFLVGARSGFPLFTGMDRFIWRGQFEGDRILGFFFSNRALMGILLGLVWLRSKDVPRHTAAGVFVVMMLISFLIGEKFTSIVLMLIGFMLPWLVNYSLSNPWKNIRTFIMPAAKLGLALTILTIPAVLVSYGWSQNSDAAVDALLQRISGQAQLWEAVAQDNPPLFHYEPANVALDKKLILHPDNDMASEAPFAGIYYLMALYMPLKAYDNYLLKGISLTMGFEPYILKQYGWIGMLLPLALAAAIYAAHLIYLGFALVKHDVIRLMLILKLMVWLNFGLQQGNFWFIISSKNAGVIVLIVLYEVWQNMRAKQRA